MALSEFLKMTLLTIGQVDPETTANDALIRVERATQRTLGVDLTSGNETLTADQFTTNYRFVCSGHTVARDLTVPLTVDGAATPVNRSFRVVNSGTGVITVQGATGATVDVDAGFAADLYCDGTDVILDGTGDAKPYDISGFIPGMPGDNALILDFPVVRDFTLPSGLTGSEARASTAPTDGAVSIDIRKNGSSVGSIDFADETNDATFTFSTSQSWVAGDRFGLVAPTPQDASFADIGFSFKGERD